MQLLLITTRFRICSWSYHVWWIAGFIQYKTRFKFS